MSDRPSLRSWRVQRLRINMAASIAGVTDAIMVDPSTLSFLSFATAAALPLIADRR
jgi:hypothetical protein